MQPSIQKIIEAELLFLKRLIIGFIIVSLSIPNIILAQSTAPITPLDNPNPPPFPVPPIDNYEALETTELNRNANLILDELEFLIADKNPRVIINSYDKRIIDDYVLKIGSDQIRSIGDSDKKKIEDFYSLYNNQESSNSSLSVTEKSQPLLGLATKNYPYDDPIVQSNFSLAIDDLKSAIDNNLSSAYISGTQRIQNLYNILHGDKTLPGNDKLPPLDRRILEYLLYLVTPTNRGGAGHEKIRVQRIWKNYSFEDDKKNISKETENATNVSAHNLGQACDVDQIDMVRCSIWQYRRIGGVKVKTQPPKTISVNYQTDAGVASAPPPMGNNFNELFKNTAYTALVSAMSEEGLLNGSLEDNLQGSSFSDLLMLAGQEILMGALIDPKNALDSESITETIEKVGRIFLADELNIPREAMLYGGDIDNIEEMAGRYLVEEKISLASGSLRHGNTSSELISSAGLRHIESIFDLGAGSLDTGLGDSKNAFVLKVGQNKISTELGISSDKLVGNSRSDWEKSIGKTKFDLVFSQPAFTDEMLSLEYGSTAKFKANGDAKEYKKLVGEVTIEDKLSGYNKYPSSNDTNRDARSEAFGLPNSTFLKDNGSTEMDVVDRMINGDNSVVYPIGAYRIAINSINSTDSTASVFKFLIDPTITTLDEKLKSEINNNTGLKNNQFADIFKNNASVGVFRDYGNHAMMDGIKNNPRVQEAEDQMLQDLKENNPELYGSIDFRVEKINDAKRVSQENTTIMRKLDRKVSDPELKRLTGEIDTTLKNLLPDSDNPNLSKIISGTYDLLKLTSQLLIELNKPQNSEVKKDLEQYIENVYQLETLAHEIISGEPYKNARDINTKDRNSNGTLLTSADMVMFLDILSEKDAKKRSQDFTSFVLSLGSRQLDTSLDLPVNSFYYMFAGSSTANASISHDGFLIAIGKAKFEEYFDKKTSSLVSPKLIIRGFRKSPENIDYDLKIENGLTDKYLNDSITIENYFKEIGEKTVEYQLLGTLTDELSILDISLTSTDVYNLLNGNGEFVLARIGGLKLDDVLDLPAGTGEKIIGAQNSDERELAVAQAAGGWLFDTLGFNPLLLSGDISSQYAQNEIETYNRFPSGSFDPVGSLDELIGKFDPNTTNLSDRITPIIFADTYKIPYKDLPEYGDSVRYTKAVVDNNYEYLYSLNAAVEIRINSLILSDQYWNDSKSDLVSKVIENDQHFDLPVDTTKKFIRQEITPAQYIKSVQDNYIHRQFETGVANAAITSLTNLICTGSESQCATMRATIGTLYHNMFSVWYDNKDISIEKWKPDDLARFYHGITAIWDFNLNETAHLPEGTIEKVLADPKNAEQTLIYGGLRSIEMEFGLEKNGGKDPGYLTIAYNYYIVKKEDRDRSDFDKNLNKTSGTSPTQIDKAKVSVKNRAMSELELRLNSFFADPKGLNVNLASQGYGSHLDAIVRGDMQFLVYIGVASVASELNSFEIDGKKFDLPKNYQVTYNDVWMTQNLSLAQEKELNDIADDAWDSGWDSVILEETLKKTRNDIVDENRRQFNGKVFTAYAYQLDQHIPADFGYSMLYGTNEERFDSAFEYASNYAIDSANLGQYGITTDGIKALNNFIADDSQANLKELEKTGVFGGIDTIINETDIFGFDVQNGTTQALAHGISTGDYGELIGTYAEWADFKLFGIADKAFGFDAGTTQQMWNAFDSYTKAREAYDTAQKTGEGLTKAQSDMAEAKAAFVTLIITLAFSDQIASMEESLGLVPGTGAMLVGMGVSLLFGAPINPMTLAIFLLINLFGVYKMKIYCTTDGYYPVPSGNPYTYQAPPAGWGSITGPEKPLNTGLPIFDGQNATNYRAGLKKGTQAKVKDVVGDTLDFPYYFDGQSIHVSERQQKPDDNSLPTQIITFDQKTAEAFWNTDIYKQIFKNNNPGENDKRGIGFSPLVPDHIHVGF